MDQQMITLQAMINALPIPSSSVSSSPSSPSDQLLLCLLAGQHPHCPLVAEQLLRQLLLPSTFWSSTGGTASADARLQQQLHGLLMPSSNSSSTSVIISPPSSSSFDSHQTDNDASTALLPLLHLLRHHGQLAAMSVPPPAELPCPQPVHPSIMPMDVSSSSLLPLCAFPNFRHHLGLPNNSFHHPTSTPTCSSTTSAADVPDPASTSTSDLLSQSSGQVQTSVNFDPMFSHLLFGPCSPPQTLSDIGGGGSSGSSSSIDSERSQVGRSSAGGTAHRLSYPREFKLIVLNSFWTNGQNKYRTCKEFQITKSMLNGWLQKADKIRQSRPGSLKSGRSGRRPQFPKIERQLFELVQHQLMRGQKPSNKWIREMAKKLTIEEEGGEGGGGGMCQFSERWLNNFKRRYGVQTTPDGTVTECCGDEERRHKKTTTSSTGRDDAVVSPPTSPSSCCSSVPTMAAKEEHWPEQPQGMAEEWQRIAREICANSDQLPIQAFYARFPKVLQQQQGKGGREGCSDDGRKIKR